MGDRVLITGGAGYIGNVLVEALLNAGYEVRVIDNLLYDQTELIRFSGNKDFEFIYGDVSNDNVLSELVEWADIIFPLAAYVGAPACEKNWIMTDEINRLHVQKIARWTTVWATNKINKKMVIYPNSNSGYGVGKSDNDGNIQYCTEDSELNPISHYGKTKTQAEATVLACGGVSFRLATVFGVAPRMRLDLLVNNFTYKALTERAIVLFESHFKRNYIHVRDVVSAFMFAIENYDDMAGEAYNLGLSDANLSKYELCEVIKEFFPDFAILESEINKDPDQRNYIVSNDKIESLGWKPKYSVRDGILELKEAYKIIVNTKNRFGNN